MVITIDATNVYSIAFTTTVRLVLHVILVVDVYIHICNYCNHICDYNIDIIE